MFSKLTDLNNIFGNTKKLFALAWEADKKTTFLYYFTAVLGALSPLALAYVLKLLIDQLQIHQGSSLLNIPLIIVFILAGRYIITLVQNVVYYSINHFYLDYLLRYRLQNIVTAKFHKKISSLDIAHFENPEMQDLISKTRDTKQWQLPDYMRIFSHWLRDFIAFGAAFIALSPFGWWIPLLITVLAVPRLYLQAKYGGIQWTIWGASAPESRKLWYLNNLIQDPTAIREMRIAQSTDAFLDKCSSFQEHLTALYKKPLDLYLKVLAIPPLIETGIIFFVGYHFLPNVLSGALTIGSFVLFISMLEQLGNNAASASSKFAELHQNNLYVNLYFEFLEVNNNIKNKENPFRFDSILPPKIEFKNVSFSYPNGQNILKNISFTIEPGESVALVGHNGAGKTTLIKLLCRFYDPTEGSILINGVNLKDLDINQWYQFLGTLFQEFIHYYLTVRENITLGTNINKGEEAMKEAAKKAGAAEFIEAFPKQYDQQLGTMFEDGKDLSGGQWQKLAIARAFYKEPPILILDEPTSAIDSEAEFEIFDNLEKQYKSKTLILVSHRFSTVRNANKIIVLDHGQIVEEGTHNDLIKMNGKYASMFNTQALGYISE